MNSLLILNHITGSINDEAFAEQIHALSHADKIEYIRLDPADLSRKKFKARTTTGRTCAISLPRDSRLENGSILHIEKNLAIVIKANALSWLQVKPKNIGMAIELGYFAGNMHWQVKFSSQYLYIALHAAKQTYLSRLHKYIADQSIEIIDNDR